GPAVAFLLTGLSYVGVLSSLLRIQTREAGQPRVGVQRGLLSHVDEGVAYVRRVPRLGRALVLLGGLSIFCMNTNVLIPVFAQEVLRQEATGYGLLMSAMGAGGRVGAPPRASRGPSGVPPAPRLAPPSSPSAPLTPWRSPVASASPL